MFALLQNRLALILFAAILIGIVAALAVPGTSMAQDGGERDDYPTLGPLLTQIAKGDFSSSAAAALGGQQPPGNLIPVTIYVDTKERLAEITAYVEEKGGKAGTIFVGETTDVYGGALTAGVPPSLLAGLAAKEGVAYVRLRVAPRLAQSSHPTIQFPNGPADVTGATAWHNEGFTGEGVRVGVIDAGYEDFATMVAPRLKTPPQWFCFPEGSDVPSSRRGEDCQHTHYHGTRVVDSLLITAPDVSLYLANWPDGDGKTHLVADAISWMLANDVQVINLSAHVEWEGPGDGTSPYIDAMVREVDRAVNGGAVWVNAAGNSNGDDWFSDSPVYQDVTVDGKTLKLIDFSLPGAQHPDTCLDVVPYGTSAYFQLRWDGAWPGAADDLDLHVYRGTEAAGAAVATSDELQDGGDISFPWEAVGIDVDQRTPTHCLAIVSKSGASPE